MKPRKVEGALDRTFGSFEKLYILSLLLTLFYFIEHPIYHNPTITRLIWIPATLIMFACCFLLLTKKTIPVAAFLGFMILLAIIAGGCIASGKVTDFDLLFRCAAFFFLILSLHLMSRTTISKRLFDWIFWVCVIVSLLFFIYSFTSIAHKGFDKDTGSFREYIYFVFNLDNSNIAGMYLFLLLCVLVINVASRRHKLLLWALIFADFYMIYRTNSRSCIIAAAVVCVVAFIPRLRKMPRGVIVLCWLFPIVFVSLYMYLYNNGYEDVTILNKSLFSGREKTFVDFLAHIKNRWHVWFGNLAGSGLFNAHNAPLAYYTSLGLVGAAISELLLLNTAFRINHNTRNAFLAVVAILGCFVQSSAEASLLLGGYPGSVLLTAIVLIANYQPEKQPAEDVSLSVAEGVSV